MRKTSQEKPEEVSIVMGEDGMCNVIVRDEIIEEYNYDNQDPSDPIPAPPQIQYSYNEFIIPVQWKSNLLELVKENFADWASYGYNMERIPDTSKDISDQSKIAMLQRENTELKEQVATLESDNELLKGCIMEIADEVFA